jgi:hypothetical protein
VAGQCDHVKPDGSPCRAAALANSRFCYFHAPGRAQDRQRSRSRGGKAAHKKAAVLPADAPDAPLGTVADVVAFLGQTANHVRKGELDHRVGNCLAVICGQLLKALLPSDLARELAELRQLVEGERREHAPADAGGGPQGAAPPPEAGGQPAAGAPDAGPLAG